ncbi:MAG TPA: SH3 domain-containing protein [Burkholderiales bacterium]|nr:SH3 domain-containing protein [Burkholderiales bacterium]
MRYAALIAALLITASAHAAEYRSVGQDAAVLYDAPSKAATPLYVVSRDYPLEVIVKLEAWVKVRDQTGALSWIEKSALSDRHMVVVVATAAQVHVRPDDASPIAFVAAQNVALELLEVVPGGWLRVRHDDGSNGYVRATLVWGG